MQPIRTTAPQHLHPKLPWHNPDPQKLLRNVLDGDNIYMGAPTRAHPNAPERERGCLCERTRAQVCAFAQARTAPTHTRRYARRPVCTRACMRAPGSARHCPRARLCTQEGANNPRPNKPPQENHSPTSHHWRHTDHPKRTPNESITANNTNTPPKRIKSLRTA